ncbi:hypothetical protein HPB51_016222 [Rhipicephalus microplus]|uniref:Protein kinase domain-containing protein n=1 Tax=Rhipicephalus microplus TaxID=6941 RepID=A0A9J6EAH0_RHIMP|nr:hypothetical protein HPB51_016222 [Rhipicephalus microplus]
MDLHIPTYSDAACQGAPPHQPPSLLRPAHSEPAVVAPDPKATVVQTTLLTHEQRPETPGSSGLKVSHHRVKLTSLIFLPAIQNTSNALLIVIVGQLSAECLDRIFLKWLASGQYIFAVAFEEMHIVALSEFPVVIEATPFNRCKATFYLVFDFCEHDLAGLLSNINVKFSLGEIKKILHRDMKAANILITKAGVLKLADFGLARAFSLSKTGQPNRYTNRVVTLWYRPPELLLGERNYGPPVDMWGAGCIMAEMWTRSPIMQGNTEQHQISLISQLCGSLTPDVWPGVEKLELYAKLNLPKGQKRKVKERLKACSFSLAAFK